MDGLKDDPLWPYLAEIIACPEAEGIILAGGFGLRLKQYYLNGRQSETGGQQITLLGELPEALATPDVLPELLPTNKNDLRGPEKRRQLLAYLRNHPEELRPFKPPRVK